MTASRAHHCGRPRRPQLAQQQAATRRRDSPSPSTGDSGPDEALASLTERLRRAEGAGERAAAAQSAACGQLVVAAQEAVQLR